MQQPAALITPSVTELITSVVLTLPVVPRDRWFICCVIGPIMLAGCMDIVWSMVGVMTAPWWRRRRRAEELRVMDPLRNTHKHTLVASVTRAGLSRSPLRSLFSPLSPLAPSFTTAW